MTAGFLGHTVVHFSFAGHRVHVPDQEVVVLPDEVLQTADTPLRRAAATLEKKFPASSDYVNNLLRRNWFQVESSERVYAVASVEKNLVTGGTGWAVQMFIDRLGDQAELYVFDQSVGVWLAWDGVWTACDAVPQPHGLWTGIGTRKLNDAGKQAIRDLMGYPASRSVSDQ